jgi:mono/diheme cytochrome c family protein
MMRKMLASLLVSAVLVGASAVVPTVAQQPPSVQPTFTRDVAPILFKHCVNCHRPGEAAPMSLMSYENARPYARAIANAIGNGSMPPWHADAPAGTFHNERMLTDAERRTLIAWADTSAPRGDAADLPSPPTFADGWSLGTPDVVLEMQEDYPIPASGVVEYEYFYVPTGFTSAKWVKSIEVRPGNRALVHHVLVYYLAKPEAARASVARANQKDMAVPRNRTAGQRPQRTDLKDMPARLIATYAPGTNPQAAPEGTAFRLEAGGILELQMHYTTGGKPSTDRTKIGISFSDAHAPREVRAQHFFNGTLRLPPGAAGVAVTTDLEFVRDATVWGLFPHTHLRGKKWDYKLVLPGGEARTILSVPKYDFNWQTYYMFKTPLQVPRGAKIVSTAWYDNSAANKSNPDATREVLWGDQTWEEMQYTGVMLSAK